MRHATNCKSERHIVTDDSGTVCDRVIMHDSVTL